MSTAAATAAAVPPPPGATPRLRADIADFARFVWRPDLRRLPPRRATGTLAADMLPAVRVRRMLAWVAMLWVTNVFVFAPIALAAASASGAQSRLDTFNLPWFMAIFWAPVVEEMVFRYGLRRPAQILWVVPLLLFPLLRGVAIVSAVFLAVLLSIAWLGARRGLRKHHWHWTWRRHYCRHFGLIFHLVAIAFAAMHLGNFFLNGTSWYLLPFLVLPQWLTGVVLGWMRVRRGLGVSMLMHSMFNAGPVLLVIALVKFWPDTLS
jgi:hypothetical protein